MIKNYTNFNEGFFTRKNKDIDTKSVKPNFFHKSISKNDLWIINPKLDYTDKLYKYYILDVTQFMKDKINFDIVSLSKECIIRNRSHDYEALYYKNRKYNKSGVMTNISKNLKYLSEGGRLFDVSNIFKKLQTINTELGFTIGKRVYIKKLDQVGLISQIFETCVYDTPRVGNTERYLFRDMNIAFTLRYDVTIENVNRIFTISEIELSENDNKLSINPEDVVNFFIDLKDDDKIKISYKILSDSKGEYLFFTIEFIDQIRNFYHSIMDCYNQLRSSFGNDVIFESIDSESLKFKIKENE